jgi:exo-beta-1,3-glucanase (GH17 family)
MKHSLLLLVVFAWSIGFNTTSWATTTKAADKPLQCAAFSPYVGSLTPDYGPPPSKQLIESLLDKLVKTTGFNCIMTYGVINGLEHLFTAAEARHLQVIAILWIDKDPAVNSQSIAAGIQAAKKFPKTIIKLSCGSEVRTRHGYAFDGEISRCINALREAKVSQPITTIDTWWEWCNRSLNCGKTSFSEQVDWIGINVFPWWENRYSPLYPCTTAAQAADFHIARLTEVQKANPEKPAMITEFGWPNGPEKALNSNSSTGQRCGIANAANQAQVVNDTFAKLAKIKKSGVVFEAFAETWKPSNEGDVGAFWGICQGQPPYDCNKGIKRRR